MANESKLALYEMWRVRLAQLQGGRPEFRDQTPESMHALAEICRRHDPKVVIEIGTNYGLSTRVFLDALEPEVDIHCIDITFDPFMRSKEVVPLNGGGSRLVFHEQDVTSVDLASLWSGYSSAMVFFDCHGPGPIAHTLKAAKDLPNGSIVVIDDMWYSKVELCPDIVDAFYKRVVLPTVDSTCPVRPVDYAKHWEGGSYYGFSEVIPLMAYLEEQQISPTHIPPKTLYWEV